MQRIEADKAFPEHRGMLVSPAQFDRFGNDAARLRADLADPRKVLACVGHIPVEKGAQSSRQVLNVRRRGVSWIPVHHHVVDNHRAARRTAEQLSWVDEADACLFRGRPLQIRV
jgi:hypothetical protein